MPPSKPFSLSLMVLDRLARAYMIGHQSLNKKELLLAQQKAEDDGQFASDGAGALQAPTQRRQD
jgi:hypothetical protein